jgi:hypothetical protein
MEKKTGSSNPAERKDSPKLAKVSPYHGLASAICMGNGRLKTSDFAGQSLFVEIQRFYIRITTAS